MFLKTKNTSECYGCTACQQVCPKDAITMQCVDNEGFLYPVIHEDKCVHCRLCEKVCPFNVPLEKKSNAISTFASMLKDKDERQKSSSGGLFYALAIRIIERGGVVFGAAFDKDLQLRHIPATSVADLELLRGSKYLQSNLGETYRTIKKLLEEGKWVYFVGTPCQVAGLKTFLMRSYETLLTSDLICHGVPSQKLFDIHKEYIEAKYNGKLRSYQFRDNKKWRLAESVTIVKGDGTQFVYDSLPYIFSPYLYSYMYAYSYRDSCYSCKFATLERQGDITLADYWGVKNFFPNIDTSSGVSIVIVNSERGKKIVDEIESSCDFYLSSIEECAQHNHNLCNKSEQHKYRRNFYKMIENKGYSWVINNYIHGIEWKRHVLNYYYKKSLVYRIVNKLKFI